jgi:hypothetical protein
MTCSNYANFKQSSSRLGDTGRAEALSWLAVQILWERRLNELKEAHAISQATADLCTRPAVAAPETMGHDRDDLDQGVGVAHGLEAAGGLAQR